MKRPIAVCASVLTVFCVACGGSPGRDQCTKNSDCPADGVCSQGLCQIGFKLTASKTGSGSGTVSASPAGIDCGTTCSASYAPDTVVKLTAAPAAGSIFAGWSGDCTGTATTASVATSTSRSCTASFTLNTSCTPPGNPKTAASALVNPPPAAPPPGTCNKTARTSQLPPAQIAALSPSQAPYRVGTTVSFRVPQGTSSFSIVSQAVSAPDAITFQSRQIPNTVVPTLIKAPDGSTIYDDNVNPPQDPSGQKAYYGGSSPSTGAFTLPNATPLLQSSAASGLAAGTWQFTVNDFALECVSSATCTGGSRTSTYDVKVLLQPGPVPTTGTIDVGFYLVTGSFDASTAAADPRVRRMVQALSTFLANGGFCLGNVSFFDVPGWAKTKYGILKIDETTDPSTGTLPCSNLDQMFTLTQYAPPGRRMNFFLVDAIQSAPPQGAPQTVVGIDGTIPGPSTIDGTVHSGAAVTVADLVGTSGCGTSVDLRSCGADVVAYIAAHEAGHFLGLYHTTESNGELFDPVADTPTCACETCAPAASQSQCATPGKTRPTTPHQMKATECNKTTSPPTCGGGENLMFWLLDQRVSRGTLSPQQGQIIRANPLVQQ